MEQELFRQIENTRGREKRSTFIEHLIQIGLNDYKNKKGILAGTQKMPTSSKPPQTVMNLRPKAS
jgi:metal-responsive CopG/Arc/MetJ family transcriptional regulator